MFNIALLVALSTVSTLLTLWNKSTTVRLRFLKNKLLMSIVSVDKLVPCLLDTFMEFSRSVLDCLDLFRKRVFEDDEALYNYFTEIVIIEQKHIAIVFLVILVTETRELFRKFWHESPDMVELG